MEKKKYIIQKNIIVCEDKFGTIILYNLNNDEILKISLITLEVLKFLQRPKTRKEFNTFCFKNKVEEFSLEQLLEKRVVTTTNDKIGFNKIFDTKIIKKISQEEKKKFPSKIGFYLTRNCNCRCIHCTFNAGQPQPLELSSEDWLKILDEAIKNNFNLLQISGGEPLIKKDLFKKIIKRAVDKFDFIGVNTNATLVDEEIAKILAHKNIVVYVSIYGDSSKIYKQVTGSDLFFQFEKGVKLLIKHGVNIRASISLIKPLIDNLDKIEIYTKNLGINVITYIGLIPQGRGLENFKQLVPSSWSAEYIPLLEKYCQKSEEALLYENIYRLKNTFNAKGEKQEKRLSGKIIDIPCHLMERRLFVFQDGSVYPCEFLPIYLGNLKFERIKEILSKN